MHADPVTDAEQHFDRVDAMNDRLAQQEAMYRDIITETLTKTIREKNLASLALPATSANRIVYVSIADVVTDEVAYGKPLEALLVALAGSDCPLVAALRKAIADSYCESHADWIAELSL